MYPVTFQFGGQKEWQYLSSGDFQALIEFIPMIGGLESGKFIPSLRKKCKSQEENLRKTVTDR